MGFWSGLGNLAVKAGKAAAKETGKAIDKSKEYRDEFKDYDSSKLVKIAKEARNRNELIKYSVAASLLKSEHGFSDDEIKARLL